MTELAPVAVDMVFPIYDHFDPTRFEKEEAFRLANELTRLSESAHLSALFAGAGVSVFARVFSHTDRRFPKPRGLSHFSYMRKPRRWSPRQWLIGHVAFRETPDIGTPAYEHRGETKRQLTSEEHLPLARHMLGESALYGLYHLCCAMNIASPGSFEIGPAFVYLDGELASTGRQIISELREARRYANRTGWPKVEALTAESVIAWSIENDLFNRVGDSALSRAFNAWTYQFAEPGHSDTLRLFWALMGVEALFNDGREGVKDQVVRRAQLLLGERTSHKADLRDMYSVRSSFVHGSLPFSGQFYQFDADPAHEQFERKVWNATSIAQAILMASLQQMVQRRWSGLHFQTMMTGEFNAPVPNERCN